jgi:hypothetical protein
VFVEARGPRFEVGDVVRAHGDDYCHAHRPSSAQRKVLRNIAACRTPALGGHVDECDSCGHVRISYNSCRDRHCPKCQGPRRAEWLAQRIERLLPVPYFHVVFTLPDDLRPLALRNKRLAYKILFDAASQTLLQIARDPKHLGAQIGITAVLHTWGQNLLFHPHLHCVVTGGGLSPDGTRWVAGRDGYFLPVNVLGKLFRGKFLDALHTAWKEGELDLAGSIAELNDPMRWAGLKDRLYRKNWVVYAKPPFGGPEHVFRYLGRYTHRVAISNHRITEFDAGRVTFTLRDYKNDAAKRHMTLDAGEFLRRFLLHVLPKAFVRIRHYGLSAGRNVHTKLAAARELLDPQPANLTLSVPLPPEPCPWWERFQQLTGIDLMACPSCATGRLIRRRALSPSELEIAGLTDARAPPVAA